MTTPTTTEKVQVASATTATTVPVAATTTTTTSTPEEEEISTIFVIGFPDDMQEREFQNMFLFCPGFEAATLKMPQDEDRRQIIGFAKFQTRQYAQQARDGLIGKKIDAVKGAMLKAEMAKKNLIVKRSGSIDHLAYFGNHSVHALLGYPVSRLYSVPSFRGYGPAEASATPYGYMRSMESSTDSGLESLDAEDNVALSSIAPFLDDKTGADTIFTGIDYFSTKNVSQDDHNDNAKADGAQESLPTSPLATPLFSHGTVGVTQTISTASSSSNLPSTLSTQSIPFSPTLQSFTSSTGGFESALYPPFDASFSYTHMVTPSAYPPTYPPHYPSYQRAQNYMPVRPVPSDQNNPPCNTLYVGNLPPNASEEELRGLFSRCPGYKRLSFRQKPNGPMCFVEFEDVPHAAQAMYELYGNPLSNSTKGGIRLSFSKNPLGVRSFNHQYDGHVYQPQPPPPTQQTYSYSA